MIKILIFVNKQTESFATELSDHLDEKEFNIRISKTSSPWETGREYYYNNRFKKYNIVFNTIGASMTFWCFRERQRNGTKFITRETSSKIGDYITRIFAPNQMVFLTMHRRNKINKYTTVIPNAIDISTTKTTHKSLLTQSFEQPIFLTTSKNIYSTVQTMYNLGYGTLVSLANISKTQAKNGQKMLGERFASFVNITQEERKRIFNDASVFIDSTEGKSDTATYLEALASNTPIVTYRYKGRCEIIGMAGLSGDLDDINYFKSLLSRASGIKWKNIPRTQAKRFNWKKTAQLYRKLFEAV